MLNRLEPIRRALRRFQRDRRDTLRAAWGARRDLRVIFSGIYGEQRWSDSIERDYSGLGSAEEYAPPYLSMLVAQTGDRPCRVVDLGCGDFHVDRKILAALPVAPVLPVLLAVIDRLAGFVIAIKPIWHPLAQELDSLQHAAGSRWRSVR